MSIRVVVDRVVVAMIWWVAALLISHGIRMSHFTPNIFLQFFPSTRWPLADFCVHNLHRPQDKSRIFELVDLW